MFRLNNQETDRSGGNMIADEKTMMELYFPPFAAVANKTAGYMCTFCATADTSDSKRRSKRLAVVFPSSSSLSFYPSHSCFVPREMMH